MKTIPGVPDLTDWTFKRGIVTMHPTSVALEKGLVVFGEPSFNGTESKIKYDGPPPSYYDIRNVELAAFPYWDIVGPP
jgi:hypothetical protein